MGFIAGKDLRIRVGGKKVWHATECSLSISSDTDEVASKDTDGKIIIPSTYGYSLSTSALYATLPSGDTTYVTVEDLIDAQLDGDALEWEFAGSVVGTRIYSGTTYVTNSEIQAANTGVATGSFTFTGSGDIDRGTVA